MGPNLAVVVEVAVDGELGLGLEAEEGVMQFLVVDVHLTHFGADLFRSGLVRGGEE